MIDLHTHSIYSDGSFSPIELLELCAKNNICSISLTDHDTVNGVPILKEKARLYDIEVINGIEFSAMYKNIEVHILGYFVDIKNKDFINFVSNLRDTREKRNNEVINILNSLGIDISIDYIKSFSKESVVTRSHFAKGLLNKGYVSSISEAFDLYLANNKKAYIKRELMSAKDAISVIKKAGGISSIAHPNKYKLSPYDVDIMIRDLKNDGIDCIECYYSSHTDKETKELLSLCDKYNLQKTAGSDFHGENRKEVILGSIYLGNPISYDILKDLKNYVYNK